MSDEQSIYGTPGAKMPLIPYRNIISDLYVHALQTSYSTDRIWEPSYAESRDADLWETIRRDAVVAAACEQRLHSVAARVWKITPASDSPIDQTAAEIVEEMLEGLEGFSQARYELASAVITARAFAYISGRRRWDVFGGKPAQWWRPVRIQDIDRRRFRYVTDWHEEEGRRRLRTVLELYSLEKDGGSWKPVSNIRAFIRHVYNDEESRLGYGRGLIEAIYFYHYAKQIVLREGLKGLERWAQGFITIKIDGLRDADTSKPNTEVQKAWLAAIKKQRSEHALAYDKNDEIDVLHGPGEGHQMVTETLRYLDEAITRLVLGSVRPTGGGEGGSYARTQEEAESTESLIQYDRVLLDETLTRDLIGAIWYFNQPQLAEVGLAGARRPRFSSIQEKKSDPRESAQVVATLLAAGVPMKREEVYERTGFTPPGAKDAVIQGQAGGESLLSKYLPRLNPGDRGGIGELEGL